MEFDPQKVNEGRLLTALSLEDRVLANGVLPKHTLLERASMVKGILTGLLEQGNWQHAVTLVYRDGGLVRGLFDGDWEGFRQGVLESARKQKPEYIGEDIVKALLHHKEADLVYRLAMELPLRGAETERIINELGKGITPAQRHDAYASLGRRYLAGNDYQEAYRYFKAAEDDAGIDMLYALLLKKEKISDLFDLLLLTAQHSKEKERERVEQVLRKVLPLLPGNGKDALFHPYSHAGKGLYALQKKFKFPLSAREQQFLQDDVIRRMSSYDAKECDDPGLKIAWARKNFTDSPGTAYAIFQQTRQTGPEVLKAVRAGLERHWNGGDQEKLRPEDITETQLRAVYDRVTLGSKVAIALHLKDDEQLYRLSRTFRAKQEYQQAYSLWVQGHGDLESPYITEIRQQMIDQGIAKDYLPIHTFDPEDRPGLLQLYHAVIETKPDVAYGLAKKVQDESLLQRARETVVRQSPAKGLNLFASEKDSTGLDLAVTALAHKFSVPKELVEQYTYTRP